MLQNISILVKGDGEIYGDFIFVDDVVRIDTGSINNYGSFNKKYKYRCWHQKRNK